MNRIVRTWTRGRNGKGTVKVTMTFSHPCSTIKKVYREQCIGDIDTDFNTIPEDTFDGIGITPEDEASFRDLDAASEKDMDFDTDCEDMQLTKEEKEAFDAMDRDIERMRPTLDAMEKILQLEAEISDRERQIRIIKKVLRERGDTA